MNRKILSLSIAITILICAVFSSCSRDTTPPPNDAPAVTSSYDYLIKELEDKILELQRDHYISDAERQKQIEELQKKLDELHGETATATTAQATSPLPKSVFIYTIENGLAIINGFTGDDDHIVIPCEIDGFEVYGISSNAFENYSFKSVIVSEGVQHIDWFAFYNCNELTSITIPTSVSRIGHSAFVGYPKNFTIYCQSGSFAQSYAQSYGITYVTI